MRSRCHVQTTACGVQCTARHGVTAHKITNSVMGSIQIPTEAKKAKFLIFVMVPINCYIHKTHNDKQKYISTIQNLNSQQAKLLIIHTILTYLMVVKQSF